MIAKVQIRPKPKVYKILVISKNESCEISLHEKVVSSQNLIFGEKSGSNLGQKVGQNIGVQKYPTFEPSEFR